MIILSLEILLLSYKYTHMVFYGSPNNENKQLENQWRIIQYLYKCHFLIFLTVRRERHVTLVEEMNILSSAHLRRCVADVASQGGRRRHLSRGDRSTRVPVVNKANTRIHMQRRAIADGVGWPRSKIKGHGCIYSRRMECILGSIVR